jgi:hypothetical protein
VHVGTEGAAIDIRSLPAAGTYTILIDPPQAHTGGMTLAANTTGGIGVGGPPVTVVFTSPGQDARLAFEGYEGQVVNLSTSDVSVPGSQISILNPDGTVLISTLTGGIHNQVLPATGTYTILIDPEGAGTGRVMLRLSRGAPVD